MPGTTLSSLPGCACAVSFGSREDHATTAFCRMHSICHEHQENGSMDIDGLKTFVAIAELGGFTRAGARLHRSQPAISRRLGLLEQELGAPLFDRLRGRADRKSTRLNSSHL